MSEGRIDRKYLIRPFSYINDSLGTNLLKFLVLLLIQIVLLFISKSYLALKVVCAATLASVLAEILCSLFLKQSLFENKKFLVSIVQGILCGMLIPQTFPMVTVFIIVFFSMLITRHFFGGFAFTWINASVISVVILWIIGVEYFPDYLVNMDLLAVRNPSQILIENGSIKVFPFDSNVTEFCNQVIFSHLKVSVPEGYVSLFWDSFSSIPAFRFNFITLISSIILFSDNLWDLLIPAIFIIVYVLLIRYISPFLYNGVTFKGDILLALLTGGTLFCAVFLISWYGTVPMTVSGKIVYGVIAGIVMFLLAGCGTSPSGMIFTVVIANIVSVIIQQYENHYDRIRIKKQLESFMNDDAKNDQEI